MLSAGTGSGGHQDLRLPQGLPPPALAANTGAPPPTPLGGPCPGPQSSCQTLSQAPGGASWTLLHTRPPAPAPTLPSTAGAPSRVPGVGLGSPEAQAQAQKSFHRGPKGSLAPARRHPPRRVREAQRGHVQNGPSTLQHPRAHALRARARRGACALPANAPLTQGRAPSTLGPLQPPEDGRMARGVPLGWWRPVLCLSQRRQPRYQHHSGEEGQPECKRLGARWPPLVPGPTSQEETSKGTVRELEPDAPRG